MLIIWGSKFYGKENSATTFGYCENCGEFGKLEHFNGKKWGHLYYIPIIPSGKRSRIWDQCSQCDSTKALPEEEIPGMASEILGDLRKIAADYNDQMPDSDQLDTCLETVSAGYEMLVKLDRNDDARQLIGLFEQNNFNLGKGLVMAKMAEMKGEDNETFRILENTFSGRNLRFVNEILGENYFRNKNLSKAEERFQKLIDADRENMYAMLMLLNIHMKTDDRGKFLNLYHELSSKKPELLKDKPIKKYYKKINKG